MRGCAVWKSYINICNCDMFNIVNVYLDHLKFCVVCINGRRCVCCIEYNVVSNECNEPTPVLCNLSVCTLVKLCTLGKLGFLNCVDICMCVVNKQFERLEFVFDSVYVDLQYDEILSHLLLGLCPCVMSVVMGSSLVHL